MEIPSESLPVLDTLRATLVACATFRKLVGAADATGASLSVHDGLVYDAEGAEGDAADVLPRAMLDDWGDEKHEIRGPGNIEGSGRLVIHIQFEQFTDEQLEAWYAGTPGFTSGGRATQRLHRKHCRNIFRRITRELGSVLDTAGCLIADTLTPFECGLENPKENNDALIWAMEWHLNWRGTP